MHDAHQFQEATCKENGNTQGYFLGLLQRTKRMATPFSFEADNIAFSIKL
jgi:hypothetical protein